MFNESRQFTFIDDLNRTGTLETLKKWYKSLEEEGKRFGYVVNVGKSDLIAKGQYKDKPIKIFKNSHIKKITMGHRHLGSVIESNQLIENYI